ncbi:protein lin-9 homolog [Anneissia japonica]|uniref:protein lin-9 homolog n=1 Tax=Anneissia japonica TaxID=1529436 RepID=UPI001425667F|nr:protein lin-9 homolog [Anneissia japonica]
MADTSLEHSAEALMSLRSAGKGKPTSSPQTQEDSPRRPPRIRKRNRLIFEDYEDTSSISLRSSPSKRTKVTPIKVVTPKVRQKPGNVLSTPDKRAAQNLGTRLKNLLKLPKAYKWCIYEWFYSNLDKALFEGENDFCVCLRESFPQLKTRRLTRIEWITIRRLMGKPRRCSSAFFAEERAALQTKRQKLRLLQQRKSHELDPSELKDLPDEVPSQLVIGTKVTARLRSPVDGLFTGQIDAVDPTNATYRITFDRPSLGIHTIPDTEVLSNEEQETIPLSSFMKNYNRPRASFFSPARLTPGLLESPGLEHDPVMSLSPMRGKLQGLKEKKLGGFPIKFLLFVTKLSKILVHKKDLIQKLRDMNAEAERQKSMEIALAMEFKKMYASNVLELERLNKDLNSYLIGVQQYCQEIAPGQGLEPMDQPVEQKLRCDQEASQIVHDANLALGERSVKNAHLNDLIASLTSLMLQVKNLASGDLNSYGFQSLNESLQEIKGKIDPSNFTCFQNNVEVHVAHIQSGMTQMGNLHAFSETSALPF